jgi:hypothetical protein
MNKGREYRGGNTQGDEEVLGISRRIFFPKIMTVVKNDRNQRKIQTKSPIYCH